MKVPFKKSDISRSRVLFIVALIFLPLIPSAYFQRTLFLVLYFAYLGIAWDILGGYTGQGSFVHAAFVGLGAYTSVLLFLHWRIPPYFSMFIGVIVSVVFAAVVGYLCFRFGLKGHFFFLASIAFLSALRYSFTNWDLVGGATGLWIPLVSKNRWLFMQFGKYKGLVFCYIMLVFLIIELYLALRIVNSKLGYYFRAIKEDELAAESLGIDTMKFKLISLCVSAAFSSIAGTMYAFFARYISPHTVLSDIFTVRIVIVAVLGGAGTLYGSLVGAPVMILLEEYTRAFLGAMSGIDLILLGTLIIMIGVLYPHGLIRLLKTAYRKIRRVEDF